jgi:replicative DNA helicase
MTDFTTQSADRFAMDVSVADLLRAHQDNDGASRGHVAAELETGFDLLDSVLAGGLSIGDLCVIGGAPGVGKTILALQMARNMAVTGHRVLYCCYEHDVATLLGRLVACEIGNLQTPMPVADVHLIRLNIRAMMAGRWTPAEPGAAHPALQAAITSVESYGDRLVLAELSAAKGTIGHITDRLPDDENNYDAVFVDYLQKVGVPGALSGIDRWSIAVEGLKNLALQKRCLVVALSALDRESLKKRRVSLDGLRGADAIAHEADVALILNDKLRAVSRSHLAFDTTLHETFAKYTVVTIEKNRRGRAPIDMEYAKDFPHFRFDPVGQFVAERLVDDHLVSD